MRCPGELCIPCSVFSPVPYFFGVCLKIQMNGNAKLKIKFINPFNAYSS
jgi:hypothetical protein